LINVPPREASKLRGAFVFEGARAVSGDGITQKCGGWFWQLGLESLLGKVWSGGKSPKREIA